MGKHRRHLPTMLLALACQSGHPAWAQSPDSGVPPIVVRSQPELRAALAAGPTPLDALTPHGRREFLAQLTWVNGGLGGYSVKALERELDRHELAAVLQWLDLDDALPRLAELLVGPPLRLPAPAAQLERDLAALRQLDREQAGRVEGGATRTDAQALLQRYRQLFGARLVPAALPQQATGDLLVLFDAAMLAATRAPTSAALDDLLRVHGEFARRDIPTSRGLDYVVLQVMLAARRFDAARDFAASRPHLAKVPVPRVADSLGPGFSGRSALAYDAASNTLTRVPLPAPAGLELMMVVDEGCHFSNDALEAVRTDAGLQARLRAMNLLIVTPSHAPLRTLLLRRWNGANPAMPIRVPYSVQEWQDVAVTGVPAFLLFRDGRLVGQYSGWAADGKAALLAFIDAAAGTAALRR